MKQIILTFFIIAGQLFSNQMWGQSQLEINEEAGNNYEKADNELNLVYNKILKEYKSDAAFIKNLKIAQRAWIKFRDAEMKSKYPDRDFSYYGSMHPYCWSTYQIELTERRTKDLKIWLEGVPEGDPCSGTIKSK